MDDGSAGHWGGERAFCARLEDHISHQRTGIGGEKERCANISKKISNFADPVANVCLTTGEFLGSVLKEILIVQVVFNSKVLLSGKWTINLQSAAQGSVY